MNRITLFSIVFVFLFPKISARELTQEEQRKLWMDTGFNLDFVLTEMRQHCCLSEKNFSACMIGLDWLFSNANKDNPHELQISDSGKLEVVPLSEKKNFENLDEFIASKNKRRESFQKFFQSKTHSEDSAFSKKFEELLQQGVDFIESHVPEENRAHFLGRFYNILLKESIDPFASLYPVEFFREIPLKYEGIGVMMTKYKTDVESLHGGLVIHPLEGSPAQLAGLKRGDIILAIDDVPVKTKSQEENDKRIRGPKETQVALTINSICENGEKTIRVTRRAVNHSFDLIKDSRFVNLVREEPLDCQDDGPPPISTRVFQALYIPLRSFYPSKGKDTLHLCREFIQLQQIDLQRHRSFGMIIDLRGNTGGDLKTALCMLNTIIYGNDILLKQIPVNHGESTEKSPSISFHFTNAGVFTVKKWNPPITKFASYNKNIVVLVDEASASASEIFAGTIQDLKRGWVIGNRTLGKGSVQEGKIFFLEENPQYKELQQIETTAIYVLNSGRSPQGHGVIPDFRFSNTGEPIEDGPDRVSFRRRFHINNIGFESNPWEQNRPDELEKLKACVNNSIMLGSMFRKRAQCEERFNRPFVANYPLELAKDILMCSPRVPRLRFHQESYDPTKTPFAGPYYDGNASSDLVQADSQSP